MEYKVQQEKVVKKQAMKRIKEREQAQKYGEAKYQKKDIYASLLEKAIENREDKYVKRFFIIASAVILIALIIWGLPYLFNGSAKIVRSFKNLKSAIKQ